MLAIDNILKSDKNFGNLDEKLKKVEQDDNGALDYLVD